MPQDTETNQTRRIWKWSTSATWVLAGFTSIIFWFLMGELSLWRSVLVVGLSATSFTIGCLGGFLFTSYGEETATVGKVREWLIGGLTGITIANVGTIKALLLTFAYGPGPAEFAVTVAVSVTYAGFGFFFMFFQRELILNVLLAKSRAIRGQVEGTRQAGLVAQKLLVVLPPSLLSGIDDIDELIEERKTEAEKQRKLLYSDEVTSFLSEAEEATKSGSVLDWDVVSKAANLHYYRTYFEKGDEGDAQVERAEEWLVRALIMNPHHADLTAKYAAVLGMQESYFDAVSTLERLNQTSEAPAYVQQWLGYYLLFVPNRETEAIRYSEEYHQRFPDESDTLFNSACGYAQMYCRELGIEGKKENLSSENRRMALLRLKEALKAQPDYAETVRTDWIEPGESFACLAKDREFRRLVGLEDQNDSSSE